ncbi:MULTISPECIES: SAVED domain-containing protein [unclassified Bradyrhizobium]|uniref:SAVED domain-containing protein n=1 Tax=unclassified Bradyrhizobium TaxID=2631580 RepID=UPI002916FBEC|nr:MULTISPECIES: SAVED domain-containing protein [unclassified Bradyrhizobium]
MADAVIPRWHGDNYQARVFWENALNLLDDGASCIVEVSFEADGPKAFDDVVVRYDPAVVRSGPERVTADYHQVKWHVEYGGRFGYADLVEPEFIGAKTSSILQRLKEARQNAGTGACFSFITTYRVKDGDPLADLISGNDRSLLVERLFDGTKTDGSRMGAVRKLWREHLGLSDNEDLRENLTNFRIFDGHRSLDELKESIVLRAKTVGVLTTLPTSSDFRLDELARALKKRGLNSFTRETFRQLCKDESILAEIAVAADPYLPVAVRSFLGPASDIVGATPENTLMLTGSFKQRYLRDDLEWQRDVRPRVEDFLRAKVVQSPMLRLILDAHASVAFVAGAVLDVKSGVSIELVQKGRIGSRVWRADDGSEIGAPVFDVAEHVLGDGPEIAVAISVAQSAEAAVRAYCKASLSNVGRLVVFALGPSQRVVLGGGHAAALAEAVANHLRAMKDNDIDLVTHVFAAAPNALLFYLGQQQQAISPCVVYEYDFDRRGNKTYQPSMIMD